MCACNSAYVTKNLYSPVAVENTLVGAGIFRVLRFGLLVFGFSCVAATTLLLDEDFFNLFTSRIEKKPFRFSHLQILYP